MSPKTQRAEKCTGNCKYGEQSIVHGGSPKEVEQLEEQRLAEEYGGAITSSKKTAQVKIPDYRTFKTPDYQTLIRGNINENYTYPQANDLEKVDTVIEAVEQGASTTTGIGESIVDDKRTSSNESSRNRDGDYYAKAAGYLGFIDHTGGDGPYDAKEYFLTDLGRDYLDADENERAEIIRGAVENMPAMEAYRGVGGGEAGREAAIAAMGDKSGETTAERRASTVEAWAKKIDSTDFNGTIAHERSISGAHIQKAIANDERRREELAQKKQEQKKKEDERFGAQKANEKQCMECFTIKNAELFPGGSSVCIDCD